MMQDPFDTHGDEHHYKPYKQNRLRPDEAQISAIIRKADGTGYLFNYAFMATSRYQWRNLENGRKAYLISIVGGGTSLVLHCLNFDEKHIMSMIDAIGKHSVMEFVEYPGNADETNEPIIQLVEEITT